MCGRYLVATEDEIIEIKSILDEINQRFAGSEELARMKVGEVCPTDMAPVLVTEGGVAVPRLLRWGFPGFSGSPIINARRETLWEKPTFRGLMLSKRCIVPASGYYEWQAVEGSKKKAKHFLYQPGAPIMMAGLQQVVRDKNGRQFAAYVIITTEASAEIAQIHDRMPLILGTDGMKVWLDGQVGREEVDRILNGSAPTLQARRVG